MCHLISPVLLVDFWRVRPFLLEDDHVPELAPDTRVVAHRAQLAVDAPRVLVVPVDHRRGQVDPAIDEDRRGPALARNLGLPGDMASLVGSPGSVPTPGALALLGLGGLMGARRRR